MDDRQSFGSLLRRHRLWTGLTHERLAELSTVSVRAISDLERGVSRRPHPETVALLADALRLDPHQRAAFLTASRPRVASSAGGGNLPVHLADFVGREREVRSLRGLLSRRDVRLVTLTGPGGSGKTRLSMQVASEMSDVFEDGVLFVPLAPVASPDGVVQAIARAVGEPGPADSDPMRWLIEQIRDQRLLVLLDNFEHLLDAAPRLLELLRGCPRVTVLVTSRAALRLSGERAFPVAPLPVPDIEHLPALAELRSNPSVALFVDRATRVIPDFELTDVNAATVARLCARLDGLPLALELAAARLTVLSPAELLERLGQGAAGERLRLLGGGARDLPDRQRTIYDTIAWSYDLLGADEQRLLRCVAIFPGGCTLAAATAVCGRAVGEMASNEETRMLDRLAALVDNSLVYRVEGADGESRSVMLETIREFALAQLDTLGEMDDLRRRHATYYLAIVETTGALLFAGAQERERAAAEQDNIQAALRWLVEHGA
jgi:predicted ATPase